METVSKVCLQHDRYWPCKESEPRGHWWAYQTIITIYTERGVDTNQLDTLNFNQTKE